MYSEYCDRLKLKSRRHTKIASVTCVYSFLFFEIRVALTQSNGKMEYLVKNCDATDEMRCAHHEIGRPK